ncbi:hypothetical protein [Bacillus cereus]|uniref:hypothetical protein n=1 Tax=Bacillus cereus TaxID=1396 RepID=UPI003D65C853
MLQLGVFIQVDLHTGNIVAERPTSNGYPSIIEIILLDGFAFITGEFPGSGTLLMIIDLFTFQGIGGILTGACYNSFLALSSSQPVALGLNPHTLATLGALEYTNRRNKLIEGSKNNIYECKEILQSLPKEKQWQR